MIRLKTLLPGLVILTLLPFKIFGQDEWHVRRCSDFDVTRAEIQDYWEGTPWLTLTRSDGHMNYATRLKIQYSESGIYMLYQCEDSAITATMKEDFMDIYKEDVVEAFFWTDTTVPLYFEYELSPLNVELPILVPNHEGTFFGWRPWHYEGDRRTQHTAIVQRNNSGQVTGWSAAFFIPYKLLKPLQQVPPKKGTQWRANFYRIDYDKGATEWSWKPVRENFHDYRRFGTIIFD
ncbi:MAG: carbohydrate-binding family 9-like protein [Cyclobacteriaceae bacterium]|nr:carbohydrate-binding family 9-like protein [Cyclobacteriaceae bacterium]